MHRFMVSVAAGKILLAKTNWLFHEKIRLFHQNLYIVYGLLATGGKPSTWFPPGRLVEPA